MKLYSLYESIDKFYPISQTMGRGPGLWVVGMIMKLENHLVLAQRGDRDAESKLINRIGQLRRQLEFNQLSDDLQDVIKRSVEFLRSVGRTVDLRNPDPRFWISQRGGGPRW